MNLGAPEVVLITMVALLLFGAKRLPELGRGLGTAMREFRRGMAEVGEEVDPPSPTGSEPARPATEGISPEEKR